MNKPKLEDIDPSPSVENPDIEAKGVLRRREIHIASARWLAKWSLPMQIGFAAIGFFIVLLPTLSTSWREIIELVPLTAWIFHEFSTLGPASIYLLAVIMVPFFILNIMVKSYPGGWNPTQEWGFPSPKHVIEKNIYPRTSKEEFVYWVSHLLGIIGTAIWLYLPFGVLAFLIRNNS